MGSNARQNGFGIAAGILWIIAACTHGWFYFTGMFAEGGDKNGLVIIFLLLGIAMSILMLIAGILLLMGQVGFLSASSMIIGITLCLFGLICILAAFMLPIFFLITLAFALCGVGFILQFNTARKVNRGFPLGSSWFTPMIFYGIGMLMLIIFAFVGIKSMFSYTGLGRFGYIGGYSGIATRGLTAATFIICGPTMIAVVLTGLFLHKREFGAGFSARPAQPGYGAPGYQQAYGGYPQGQQAYGGYQQQAYGGYPQGQQAYGGYPQGQQAYGGYQQQGQQAYGGYQQGQQAYGGYQQGQQAYGGYQQGQQAYGGYQQDQQAYGGYQQGQQAYSGYQQQSQQAYGGYQQESAQDVYQGSVEASSYYQPQLTANPNPESASSEDETTLLL